MLHAMPVVTQDQQAASDGALMTDAAQGWALIAYLDAKFGNPACALCCAPATANSELCAECEAAASGQGPHYCPDGIDWEAVENDRIGD